MTRLNRGTRLLATLLVVLLAPLAWSAGSAAGAETPPAPSTEIDQVRDKLEDRRTTLADVEARTSALQARADRVAAKAGAQRAEAGRHARRAAEWERTWRQATGPARELARQAMKAAQRTRDAARERARTLGQQARALTARADRLVERSDALAGTVADLESRLRHLEVGAELAEILEGLNIPGAQVVYSRGGEAESYTYGVLNRDTESLVREDSLFQAASLSKVVGAYLVLRRVDQGVIDLDTPLSTYFDSPRTAASEAAHTVTARMVLNHTTGFPNWAGAAGAEVEPLEPAWEPGTKFGYSGEGFFLLQRTIEHLDGQPFEESLREEVFEPFGMVSSTLVTRPENAERSVVGHDAAGLPAAPSNYPNGNTAYTLQTNAHDYDRFIQQALFAGRGLSEELHREWFAVSSDADRTSTNPANPYVDWGLGVGLQHNRHGTALWHWGDNGSRKAFFLALPETEESVVMFWNSVNGQQSANAILSLFLGSQAFHALTWVG